MPQLRSGCVGFGALQDLVNFITSVHSHLEKANLFQRGAFGNSRRYHSQVSSAQQNMIFFSFFFFSFQVPVFIPFITTAPELPRVGELCARAICAPQRKGWLWHMSPDASAGSRGARARGGGASTRLCSGTGGTGGFRRPPCAANGSLLSSSLMPLLPAYCNCFH